jgi:type II secretory pathway component PulF
MQYAYVAKSMQGETSRGMLSADSMVQARQQLRQQGLFALSLAPAARKAAPALRRSWRRRRVSRKDLMTFTSQFAIMTKAGIDIAGAIESLARQCLNPNLKATLQSVHQEVLSGKSMSMALRNHIEVFGDAYVASVAAGEASGRLPDVLARLAAMQRVEVRMQSTRRTLLAYPIVLTTVSLLVVFGLVFFVLPQFAEVFEQFGMALPTLTTILLAIASELRARWWVWGPMVVGSIVGLLIWRKSPSGRRAWDRFLLNAAMVRDVTRSVLTGRAFRLLGIMLESGVPLIEALRLTRSSIQNSLYRQLFDQLERDVLNGRPLADALAYADFVPPGATEMIATAERTGTLDTVAQIIGEHYEEEGESKLRELATLIEPAIIVVMGALVACIVLAVMLPMFDFATLSQN